MSIASDAVSAYHLSLSPSSHLKAKSHSPDSGLCSCALTHTEQRPSGDVHEFGCELNLVSIYSETKQRNSTLVSVQQLNELVYAESKERERDEAVSIDARATFVYELGVEIAKDENHFYSFWR